MMNMDERVCLIYREPALCLHFHLGFYYDVYGSPWPRVPQGKNEAVCCVEWSRTRAGAGFLPSMCDPGPVSLTGAQHPTN